MSEKNRLLPHETALVDYGKRMRFPWTRSEEKCIYCGHRLWLNCDGNSALPCDDDSGAVCRSSERG